MKYALRLFLLLLLAGLQPLHSGHAVNPSEMLADPALEERAREISKDLRCLVCQNQSIDDSDAQLARDLRVLVRERLKAGDSDRQVIDYVVSRYGDFVLLRPPFKATTLVLWSGPAAIAALGLIAVVLFYRHRGRPASTNADRPPPLSEDEKRRLQALLKDDVR
jgi:cytochrome c-type biogenesis protein CcmH